MRRASLCACLLCALSGPALAQSNITSMGSKRLSFEMPHGQTSEVQGMSLGYEGRYLNGVKLNADAFLDPRATSEISALNFDAAWQWNGFIGPKIAHSDLNLGEIRSDRTMAGLSMSVSHGGFTLNGDALSDIDAFGDQTRLGLELEWQMNDSVSLSTSYGRETGIGTEFGGFAAEYDIGKSLFISANAERARERGGNEVFSTGLIGGFRF